MDSSSPSRCGRFTFGRSRLPVCETGTVTSREQTSCICTRLVLSPSLMTVRICTPWTRKLQSPQNACPRLREFDICLFIRRRCRLHLHPWLIFLIDRLSHCGGRLAPFSMELVATWSGVRAHICRITARTVLLLAVAFPGFFNLIAWGQTSAVALACFTLLFFLLRDRREFLAGLALGCLIFKPQLGLAAAVVFVAIGAWKTMGGAVISAAAQLLVGVAYYGAEPLRKWMETVWNLSSVLPELEPRPYQTHCLRTFWSMLVPWEGFLSRCTWLAHSLSLSPRLLCGSADPECLCLCDSPPCCWLRCWFLHISPFTIS